MTRSRALAVSLIVGLSIACAWLTWKTITSSSPPADVAVPNRFEISSIDLSADARDATLSARDMVPGDSVATSITVTNSGREPVMYAMRRGHVAVGGHRLSAALLHTIKTIGSSCADVDGTTLFDGPLDDAAFGNEVDDRPLPAATAEILCFRAELPWETGDELQGSATTVALSFGATRQAAAP